MKIFDRKKHIFKLSQGEYLAPDRLEGVFSRSKLIISIFVDGDSRYSFPVALVYPSYEAFKSLRNDTRMDQSDFLKQRILQDLVRLGQESGLKSYEVPKCLFILDEAFSEENGCITPSQKTRRERVRLRYKNEIAQLYIEYEDTGRIVPNGEPK